jgi:sulfite exporter TauE/SafE
MPWQLIVSGFVLGILSSFHCVGMCGPIALVLPVHTLPSGKKLAGILVYNTGRVVTYSLLGLFFGFAGRQIYLGGLQQWFSIILGCSILTALIISLVTGKARRWGLGQKVLRGLQTIIGKYIRRKQLYSLFIIGTANGLLPCGMVYFAIAGALATGSLGGGVIFMASFGLGTIPFMVMLCYFGQLISISARNSIKKTVPWLMASLAILLILRGMNLGIPYVSPFFDNAAARTISCH